MKRTILTALLVATASTNFAMGDDLFAQKNPMNLDTPAVGYEIEVAMPETVVALEDLGQVLEEAHAVRQDLAARQANGERLTDRQERFIEHDVNHDMFVKLDKHLTNRVEFFKRAHNWNGNNKYEHSANYHVFLNKNNEAATETVDGYSNSYGWNVLRNVRRDALDNVHALMQRDGERISGFDVAMAIRNAAEANAVTVNEEELRYYINELTWYVAKQAAKETRKELRHVLK